MDKNSIKIKNVDENGIEIPDIDWGIWKRIRVEEVLNDNDEVAEIVSHCQKYNEEELKQRLLSELKATETSDIEAALCELAEEQAAYQNDVNAALCELYELIEGGATNG